MRLPKGKRAARPVAAKGHRPLSKIEGNYESAVDRTDNVLKRLPDLEWTVLGEIDHRHGIDHVVIGRKGVFLVASRMPAGPGVSVRDGVLWLRRGPDARSKKPGVAINRDVLDCTRSLTREIRARTGRGPKVHPVVVLWCEFPQSVAESSQIAFVHGRDLLAWLSGRPQELDDRGRQEIISALRAMPTQGSKLIPHLRSPHRAA